MSEVQFIILLLDIGLALILQIMGLCFIRSKGKGVKFIAGFNNKSEKEQSEYNLRDICIDFGMQLILYGTLFTGGVVIDLFFTGGGISLASVGFMVLVFVNVYRSKDSLFDKCYRL
ncbi:MAG: DUF3784 domain-containing protein [Lachnospiraceae bacterium]|jgi:hypothetical protein|nr:DUF3784 domain-containing protein [Lachnospiraceae bacterium]